MQANWNQLHNDHHLKDGESDSAGKTGLLAGLGQAICAIIDCSTIIDCMGTIIIRNLDETTKRKLKVRAAMNGRSMEQEVREILKSTLAQTSKKHVNLAERVRAIFGPLGGVELERPPREPVRDPDWLGARVVADRRP
jgi:antitoxin FitA